MIKVRTTVTIVFIAFCAGCGSKIKEKNDEVYSRHLQKKVPLTIINTPVPDNKSDYNLLILNDGQEVDALRVKEITDSLYRKKRIGPLLIVGVTTLDRAQWYGVSGYPDYLKNGTAAEKYSNFIINELLPFVKKRSGVRKFNSVTIAGNSLGAVSALDIAWNHADKIDRVGLFSGEFGLPDMDPSDPLYSDDKNRVIFNKIKSSRKRPKLEYWFYAGGNEGNADRDKDGVIDVIDNSKDMMALIEMKKVSLPNAIQFTEIKEGKHDYASWSTVFPQFLIWIAGK